MKPPRSIDLLFYSKHNYKMSFTVFELLVVVGIIAILGSLLLPALSRAKAGAQGVRCINNERQIMMAWGLYAEDQADRILPNLEDSIPNGVPTNWVTGSMARSQEATNGLLLVDPTKSLIASYVKSATIFKCPTDSSRFVRSVSMNCRMNPMRALGPPNWVGGTFRTFRTTADILRPTDTLVILEERSDTINDGYFAVDMSNSGVPTGDGTSHPYYLIDYPASRHNSAGMVSFADSHVESHKWLESTTKPPLGQATARSHTFANDRDAKWLQEHATYRPE